MDWVPSMRMHVSCAEPGCQSWASCHSFVCICTALIRFPMRFVCQEEERVLQKLLKRIQIETQQVCA